MRGSLDPLAVTVDTDERMDGTDDGSGCHHGDTVSAVDDASQGMTDVAVAKGEQVEGVGMAVDGACVDAVVLGHVARTVPANKFLLDVLAILMAADRAASLVRGQARILSGLTGDGPSARTALAFRAAGFGFAPENGLFELLVHAGDGFVGGALLASETLRVDADDVMSAFGLKKPFFVYSGGYFFDEWYWLAIFLWNFHFQLVHLSARVAGAEIASIRKNTVLRVVGGMVGARRSFT